MRRFNEARVLLPGYISNLLFYERARLTALLVDCPDLWQEQELLPRKVALLAQIRSPCKNTNGSNFAFHIQDYTLNQASLMFYVPLEQQYYMHPEFGKPSRPATPLWSQLTPGTMFVLINFCWCLFRNGVGFRVDDLRQIYILPASAQPQQQKGNGGQGAGTETENETESAGGSDVVVGNESALEMWSNPYYFRADGDSLSPVEEVDETEEMEILQAHIGSVGAAGLGMERQRGEGSLTGAERVVGKTIRAGDGRAIESGCGNSGTSSGGSKTHRKDNQESGRNAKKANGTSVAKGWKSKNEKKVKKGKKSQW
ncbi:hypothetical protein EGW08_005803 [Elysia chlorotica]|uniref:Uncharacterized protein n=1 Tax=Elysia chlorotica TaxID=188477 RepID=A0A3S0ZYV8_ELYCH|nr:hypothetical protein EGW08_005803 [Elysia chlorotica]